MWDTTQMMSLLNKKMSWLAGKAQVHASNLANVDTPGMQRKDVKPFQKLLTRHTTIDPNPAIGGLRRIDSAPLVIRQNDIYETGEENSRHWESLRMAETETQHKAVTNIYAKFSSFVKTVAGGPK